MIASFKEKQLFWFPCHMNQLKKRRGKNRVCGPYYTTRRLITGPHPGNRSTSIPILRRVCVGDGVMM